MASLPRTLASIPVKVATGVGRAIRDPLKPVRDVRNLWAMDDDEPQDFGEMTLGEHLNDLRNALVKSCYAFAPAFIVGIFLAAPLMRYMAREANTPEFQVLSPTGGFVIYMKVGLYMGIIFAFPIIFYQLFSFISPGMTRKEKRYVASSLPFVTLLFAAGASFAFFFAAPRAFDFLSSFQSSIFEWKPVADDVISFYLTLTLGLGIAFELPALMFMLAKLKIVNAQKQKNFWRIAMILIMVAAAIITPTPDPFNMMVVASPLVLLYIFGLFMARVAEGGRKPKEVEAEVAQ
jgi:sec-independent protein translocase protein TatC